MGDTNYKLRYLPLFYRDLEEKIVYIAETLQNPKAANDLLNDVENAIFERLPNAESFEPYHSAKERRYKYYRIYVKNYIVYYVVIDNEGSDKIMEVRRFLYNKQNRKELV
ncbi:MAG: type II toxin-antitoxin system RelE/ParE family toxin [Mediterraneibacter faecis]